MSRRSEFRRLGKRGSYRFGWLAVPGAEPAPRPAPFVPRFGSRTRSGSGTGWAWPVSCAVAAVVLGFGASAFGLWWLPFAAGVLGGLSVWRARSAVLWGCGAVCVGWGGALWWPALVDGAPAGATARVVAALAGLPPFAGVGVAGTLLVGILQVLAAVWLTRALRRPGGAPS